MAAGRPRVTMLVYSRIDSHILCYICTYRQSFCEQLLACDQGGLFIALIISHVMYVSLYGHCLVTCSLSALHLFLHPRTAPRLRSTHSRISS